MKVEAIDPEVVGPAGMVDPLLVLTRQADPPVTAVVVKAVSGWQLLAVTIVVDLAQTLVILATAPGTVVVVQSTNTSCVTIVCVHEEDEADED